MKLFALAIVKDEGDIIEQSVRHAARFCDRVFVLDNGSSDDSWAIVEALAAELPDSVTAFGVDRRPFTDDMRRLMYDELRIQLGPQDWFMQLDADEFLLEDPRPFLTRAGDRGVSRVRTWQAQFQFTDRDLADYLADRDDRRKPIETRRRSFVVDWREDRFWRNEPTRAWVGAATIPDLGGRTARRALVNRHYQNRDPEQMARRLELRRELRSQSSDPDFFKHVDVQDWRDLILPAAGLRQWTPGGPLNPLPWRYFTRRIRDRIPF